MSFGANLFGICDDERELLKLFEAEEAEFERDLQLAAEDRAREKASLPPFFDVSSAAPVASGRRVIRPERRLGWMPTR